MSYYSYATYTTAIDNSGYLNVHRRSDMQKCASVNINQYMGVISKNPNADEFMIIGSSDPVDDYLSNEPLAGNDFTLNTSGEIEGYGGEKPISINGVNIQITLDESLTFYTQLVS